MWRPLSSMLLLSALAGCIGHRPLGDNQACPCAPGWSCDAPRNVCVPTSCPAGTARVTGGSCVTSGSGGTSGNGGGGSSGSDASGGGGSSGSDASGGGGSCPGGTVPVPGPGECSAPDGHLLPVATVADLETLIEGDWLLCHGSLFFPGVGLRISPDHTWNGLEAGDGGALAPITTGFAGYGTWTILPGQPFQFNLLTGSGGVGYHVLLTDSGQMRLNYTSQTGDYVRLSGGGGCTAGGGDGGASDSGDGGASGSGDGGSGSGEGGSGGTAITVPGPGDCSAPDGHVLSYATLADLEVLIEGDWLKCSGSLFVDGDGLRVSPDHTWNSLERGDGGTLQPITTGFDGYGTWADGAVSPTLLQFYLFSISGLGTGYYATFTDSGQMRLNGDGNSSYVRLAAGSAGVGP